MFNDYPIYNTYFDRARVSQNRGCNREPQSFYPCPCFHRPPRPPFPPGPPYPPIEPALRLRKLDACSNNPLAGATFELTRDGVVIAEASSPASGEIDFGCLAPGRYQLRETVAPPDHKLDTAVYEVEVYGNGAVAVNGDFTRELIVRDYLLDVSQAPLVNTVTVLADTVGGTGSAGCVITVFWPDGTESGTTVNGGGAWAVSRPALLPLEAGDIIRVNQTCPQHLPSEAVCVGVRL